MESDALIVARATGTSRFDASFLAAAAILAVAMGIGRFAYTPLLVIMQREGVLDVASAGVFASANLSGYLAGALAAMHPALRNVRYPVLCVAAAAVALTTATMALPVQAWGISRFATGVASGIAFVLTVSLTLDRAAAAGSRWALAIVFSGVGSGIVLAAVLVAAFERIGPSRFIWLGIAGCSAAILAISLPLIRDIPASAAIERMQRGSARSDRGAFAWLCAAYGLEGAAYVIPATFLVAMVRETPGIARFGAAAWVVVGLAAIPATAFCSRLAARFGRATALVAVMMVQAAAMLVPLVCAPAIGLVILAVLLGVTFVGVSSLATALARDLRPNRSNVAIGLMTVIYGIGQIAGPLIAARMTLLFGHYRTSLVAAAALAAAGSVLLIPTVRMAPRLLPGARGAGTLQG